MNVPRSNESPMIQTPAGTNGDTLIYSTNNTAPIITATTSMSPPTLGRNSNANGAGVDVTQRQTVWPTAITTIDQRTGGDENDNEGKHCNVFFTFFNTFTTIVYLLQILQITNQ